MNKTLPMKYEHSNVTTQESKCRHSMEAYQRPSFMHESNTMKKSFLAKALIL